MQKKVCVILANGFEEVEAITPIDYLMRAGAEVTLASLDDLNVKGSHGIIIHASTMLANENSHIFDCVVIPGGSVGAKAIANSGLACQFIKRHAVSGSIIAAICAAPALVLGQSCQLLENKPFTCYPNMEQFVPKGIFSTDRVVVHKNIITSRSAGCSGEFAIEIIRQLYDDASAKSIADKVLLK